MSKFRLDNDMLYETKTGSAKIYDTFNNEEESYAILIKSGHCGRGYYMPEIIVAMAKSVDMAIDIAKNVSRAKTTRKNVILAVTKISELERLALSYFNGCNPYRHSASNHETDPYIAERRIIMEEAIDFDGTDNHGKIPIDLVRTADKYPEYLVLQRNLAPSFYGDKLIFPKTINFRNILDDYIYYETIAQGIYRNKAPALAFYYQLYGPNNKLKIRYHKNGKLSYFRNNELKYAKLSPEATSHIEEAEKKFKEIEKKRIEEEKLKSKIEEKPLNIKSSTDRFNERYKKYLNIKNRSTKLP